MYFFHELKAINQIGALVVEHTRTHLINGSGFGIPLVSPKVSAVFIGVQFEVTYVNECVFVYLSYIYVHTS